MALTSKIYQKFQCWVNCCISFPLMLADEEGSSPSSEQEEDDEAAEESSDEDNDEGYKPPSGKKQRIGSVVSITAWL